MFSSKALERVKVIDKKIGFIEAIVREKGSVIVALEDEQMQELPFSCTSHPSQNSLINFCITVS